MAKGTLNKVMILGRLGNDPEVRTTQNGTVVASLSIATNDGIGENITTEWHRVTVFGKGAEVIQKYCTKGSQLFVEGRISTSKYQDKNGNTQYSTQIIANNFQFIGGSNSQGGNNQSYSNNSNQASSNQQSNNNNFNQQPTAAKPNNMPDFAEINSSDFDDDIPF
ncbi:MAG: single-strand DNA-binding protein [Francisella sp.]|jgi:single-strand DNA-binding protein